MLDLPIAGFDWDDGNRAKCAAHGVAVEEIEGLFRGRFAVLPDPGHSLSETRLRAVGRPPSGRPVFLVFTIREIEGTRLIRPISARYMHRKEIAHYAEANSSLQDG